MFRKAVKSLGERFACLNRETSQTSDQTIIDLVSQLKTRGFVILDHLVGNSEFIKLKDKLDKKIEQEFDLKFPCLAQSKIDQNRDRDLIARNFLTSTDELKKVYEDIDALEKTVIQTTRSYIVVELFPYLIGLIAGIILLRELIVLTSLIGVRT